MAYKNPNAPIIARYFATAENGQRIVISSQYSNLIQFFGKDPFGGVANIAVSSDGLGFFRMFWEAGGSRITLDNTLGAELNSSHFRLGDEGVGDNYLSMNRNGYAGWTVDKPLLITDPNAANTPETWHNAPLSGTWAPFSVPTTPRYRMTSDGTVYVQGIAAGGSANVIMIFPVGYRPTMQLDFPLKINNDASSMAWCRITTAGVFSVISNVALAQTWTSVKIEFSTL